MHCNLNVTQKIFVLVLFKSLGESRLLPCYVRYIITQLYTVGMYHIL